MEMKVPDIYGYVRKNCFRLTKTVSRERITEIRLGYVDRDFPDDFLLEKTINVGRFLPQLSVIGIIFSKAG
jgi:hypothetical protein